MIIFLYGQDTYRLRQNLDKIVDEYKKKNVGIGYLFLDFNEPKQILELGNSIKTVSFFDEKKLIVLKNSFLESKEISKFIKTWELAEDKQRILIFVEDQTEAQLSKSSKSLFAALSSKPNLVKSFEELDGKKLENWISKEVVSLGFEIDLGVVQKLISNVGEDVWRLGQEIIKLTNYKTASGIKKISEQDVDLLVKSAEDTNIFHIVDAVANKNKPKAATMIYEHIWSGGDPYYIFSMIVYQFRNLLRIKSLIKNASPYELIIKKTGLNPYVVKKTHEQSKKYDLDDLKSRFHELVDLEFKVKTGVLDMAEGLYQFVFSL